MCCAVVNMTGPLEKWCRRYRMCCVPRWMRQPPHALQLLKQIMQFQNSSSITPCLMALACSTGLSHLMPLLACLPNCMAFSNVLRKFASVSLITRSPASFSMFLIHLFARPCGSMHSGHRRPATQHAQLHIRRAPATLHQSSSPTLHRLYIHTHFIVCMLPGSCLAVTMLGSAAKQLATLIC